MTTLPTPLAAAHLGPIQVETPIWLGLIVLLWPLALWIGRSSLAGLGPVTRWVALSVRLLVIALLAFILAEPSLRKESKDVAVTVVVDASRSIPAPLQNSVDQYVADAAERYRRQNDELGVVTIAKDAYVQALASRRTQSVERLFIGATDGTNIAAGISLAMAATPKDAAARIILASDGNETEGSLLQAAQQAKASNVPIDVLPLRYRHDSEVIVERLVAPSVARRGENVTLKAMVTATRPTDGRLTILQNGIPIDLDPDSDSDGVVVELLPGLNPLSLPVTLPTSGPQEFEAIFEPLVSGGVAQGDSIVENNRALAVTFVGGEGRALVISTSAQEAEHILGALADARIRADAINVDQVPTSLAAMNAYDCVIMINQEVYGYTEAQQSILRQYIHDTGGGLIMIGGPDAFGAGGWIGSPLEDALPIKLDPPAKRQMPRGALALVMHSIEMPEGVFYGKKTAESAVAALSRLDYAGIIEFTWDGGTDWVHPLAPVGDGSAVRRSIQNLQFGDMPDFAPSLQLALAGLTKVDAGQKHVIMISDGDPSPPSASLLKQFRDNRISISTVGVFPHSSGDTRTLENIARDTGGRHYFVNTQQALATIPQIFIKEAQTIRRTLIWEGQPFSPTVTGGAADTMRGIAAVPPISGYIVAADREGLSMVTLRGKENDPVAAQWQYGLGRVITFTSDATTRWAPSWTGWGQFRAFWEQHVRWAMRPTGSADVRIETQTDGDVTTVQVEAFEPTTGERLNSAAIVGRVGTPTGTGQDLSLRQVAPGRYVGKFKSDEPGSYVLSFRFSAPGADGAGVIEGSALAAVTRPFADEFRALEDNAPLLAQIAQMTGGVVLPSDGRQADLWRREGLVMPVATTPIWLALTIATLALFLADVAVRRVRIDIPAMARSFRKALARGQAKAGQQMDSLQAARAKAKQAMAARAQIDPQTGKPGAAPASQHAGQQVAKRKFEASPEQIRSTREPAALSGEPTKASDLAKPKPAAPKPDKPEEGMSRLMEAKKKAREGMEDR